MSYHTRDKEKQRCRINGPYDHTRDKEKQRCRINGPYEWTRKDFRWLSSILSPFLSPSPHSNLILYTNPSP